MFEGLTQFLSGMLNKSQATPGTMFSNQAFNRDASGGLLPADMQKPNWQNPAILSSLFGQLAGAITGPDSVAGRVGGIASNWGSAKQYADLLPKLMAGQGQPTPGISQAPVAPNLPGQASGTATRKLGTLKETQGG